MKEKKAQELLSFFIEIEKLKTVMRHSYTSNKNRQESSAEHSWLMGLIAMTIFEHLDKPVDQLKVLQLVLFHDLAEIITSDIPAFEISERQNNKKTAEKEALQTLLKPLAKTQQKYFLSLWEEFEEHKTREAHVAQAIDKMEVLIQHNIADMATWDQGDFDIHPFYRTDFFDFDSFLRTLRDEVEVMSLKKILQTNTMHRVKPVMQKKWQKLQKEKNL